MIISTDIFFIFPNAQFSEVDHQFEKTTNWRSVLLYVIEMTSLNFSSIYIYERTGHLKPHDTLGWLGFKINWYLGI